MKAVHKHASYFAFLGHRLSGLALALFLPAHLLVLSMSLKSPEHLDSFLKWADQPWVKASEWGLIALFTLHLGFGLRLLTIEYLPWIGQRKILIWFSVILALVVSGIFLMRAF